jgi:hypothetical protein
MPDAFGCDDEAGGSLDLRPALFICVLLSHFLSWGRAGVEPICPDNVQLGYLPSGFRDGPDELRCLRWFVPDRLDNLRTETLRQTQIDTPLQKFGGAGRDRAGA